MHLKQEETLHSYKAIFVSHTNWYLAGPATFERLGGISHWYYLWLTSNIRDVFSSVMHLTIAIFKLGLPFDHMMMPWKFHDYIANGSKTTLLTDMQRDRQTKSETDTAKNNTFLLYCVTWMTLSVNNMLFQNIE